MFYENSIGEIRKAILKRASDAVAEEVHLAEGEKAPFSHILWMCDQIETMDVSSIQGATKASRWIGYIFAHMEMHRFLDNREVRSLSRKDVELGNDVPQ